MNIAIVDDQQTEIDALTEIIKEYARQAKIDIDVHTFHNAEDIIACYRPYTYTAIFMDIYMDGTDGIQAAEELLKTDKSIHLIFLTSSSEHMPEAFSLHAYDYIPKPASKERIFKTLNDIMLTHAEYNNSPKLTFTCDKKEISIAYPDIVLVRTAKHNYIKIVDRTGSSYLTRLTFLSVAELLSEDGRFLVVIRGVLVNMDYIRIIEEDICELDNGIQLSINVRNARTIKTIWQNYKLQSIRNEMQRKKG